MCCSVFPGLAGQEFIFPACHWVSQRKKGGCQSNTFPPSTCLLPAEHVISHHNSGLLLQIQQSAWPGPREHSDRYQTRDGWHTTRTLTVSPFSLFYMSAWIPYKMQSRWCMLQVAKDRTGGWDMHLFACLARWRSLKRPPSSNRNLVWLLLQPVFSFFMHCICASAKKLILLCIPVSAEKWQCSIYITSDAKMSKLTAAIVDFNQVSVF